MSKIYIYKASAIDAGIETLVSDYQKVGDKIRNLLVSVAKIMHDEQFAAAKKNEDLRPIAFKAAQRFNAIADGCGYHAKAINNWVAAFFPMLAWDEDIKGFCLDTEFEDARLWGKMYTGARDMDFRDFTPPTVATPVTNEAVRTMLENLIKKAKRHSTDKGDTYDDTGLEHLEAALVELKAD